MSVAPDPGDLPARLLVVDDNTASRYIFAQWLHRAGHEVLEAADGAEALELLAGPGPLPEVAVLDVALPDMTGFELCHAIKGTKETADIPVVHVSASAVSVSDRAQGLHGGADAYLTKPVDPDELLATITAVLRYTRARRAAQTLAERLLLLNEATLRMHGATEFAQFAAAAVQGILSVLGADAASVYLSLSGRLVRTYQADADSPLVSEPLDTEAFEQITDAVLGARIGARTLFVPAARWRELVHGPRLSGDVLVAAVRAHRGRPPVCVAVAVQQEPSEDDRRLLLQIAQACSLSLESLRSYAEEHALALRLQRSFLPARLPAAQGVELAVRYVPASAHTEIGGDFYEAISTPDGLLLVIGDVVGHSLDAAMLMGEVRHALRAYADRGAPARDDPGTAGHAPEPRPAGGHGHGLPGPDRAGPTPPAHRERRPHPAAPAARRPRRAGRRLRHPTRPAPGHRPRPLHRHDGGPDRPGPPRPVHRRPGREPHHRSERQPQRLRNRRRPGPERHRRTL